MTDLAERLARVAADSTDEQAAHLAKQLAALVGNTDDRSPEALAERLSTAISAPLAETFGPGWRQIGQAAKLHQEAYSLLREADAMAQHAELAAVIPATEQARQLAEHEAEVLTEAERVALGALRFAEERHREAAEHHQQCADVAELAAAIGDDPKVQTEMVAVRNAASEVLGQFAAKLAEAQQDHAHALARASEARGLVTALRTVEQAARGALADAEQHPERAPRGTFTLSVGMTGAVGEYDALTADERIVLRGLVADLAAQVGAVREARNESRQVGYEQGLRDARHEARMNFGPVERGNVLPPGVGRR